MKMPNLASLYHCGCWYLTSEAQLGRKGPSLACFSASATRRLRSASYLATDFCHSRSISAADFVSRVGASGSADCAEANGPRAKARRGTQNSEFFISHEC